MKTLLLISAGLLFLNCSESIERVPLNAFENLSVLEPTRTDTLNIPHSSKVVMIAANSSYLYVLGKDSSGVYRYSKDSLNLYSTHLLHGRGPGELSKPSIITVSENRVLIMDDDDQKVQIYDTNMVHIESISVNGIVNSLDVIGNDYFLLSFVELGQSRLQIYDTKLVKTFTLKGVSDHPLDLVGIAQFIDNDRFTFLRRYINQGFVVDIKSGENVEFRNPYLIEKSATEEKMNMLIPKSQLILQALPVNGELYVLSGLLLEEGQPLFKLDDNGKVTGIWIFKESNSVLRAAISDSTLFGYSFIHNTLSKYKL